MAYICTLIVLFTRLIQLVDKREDIKNTLLDKLGDLDHGKVRINGTEIEKVSLNIQKISQVFTS